MKPVKSFVLILVLATFYRATAAEPPESNALEPTAAVDHHPQAPARTSPRLRGTSTDGILTLLRRHVEIGTRITHFELKDDRRSTDDTFLGSIIRLDDKQDLMPTKLFLAFRVNDLFGFELNYDKVAARTITVTGKSDGTISMSGPIVSLFARYPNQTAFTPFAGFGLAYFSAAFNETDHWRLGYDSPEDYISAGKPATPKGDRLRTMHVSSDVGRVIVLGLIWRITNSWALDAFWRTMDVEADAVFTSTVHGVPENSRHGEFPLDHDAWGLGAKYIF